MGRDRCPWSCPVVDDDYFRSLRKRFESMHALPCLKTGNPGSSCASASEKASVVGRVILSWQSTRQRSEDAGKAVVGYPPGFGSCWEDF